MWRFQLAGSRVSSGRRQDGKNLGNSFTGTCCCPLLSRCPLLSTASHMLPVHSFPLSVWFLKKTCVFSVKWCCSVPAGIPSVQILLTPFDGWEWKKNWFGAVTWLTQGHVVLSRWSWPLFSNLSPCQATGFGTGESSERILFLHPTDVILLICRWFQKQSNREGTMLCSLPTHSRKERKHSPVCSSFALQDPGSMLQDFTVYYTAFIKRVPITCFSPKDSMCSLCAALSTYHYIFTFIALHFRSCLPLILENNLHKVVLSKTSHILN